MLGQNLVKLALNLRPNAINISKKPAKSSMIQAVRIISSVMNKSSAYRHSQSGSSTTNLGFAIRLKYDIP